MPSGPLVLVTVVHPCGGDIVTEAAQLDGVAAQVREAEKVDAYKTDVENGVYEFEALVHEAYGAMGRGARRHLKRLATVAAASGKVGKGAFMRSTVLALSVALQRGNGIVIRKGMQEWSKAAGRQFVYGLPVPTAEL